MPGKGTPRQAIRLDPDLWEEYELACADEGTTRAEHIRAHVVKTVRAWKRRKAKEASSEPDAGE